MVYNGFQRQQQMLALPVMQPYALPMCFLGKLIEVSQNAMQTPGWEIEFWSPVAVASIIAVVLYIVGQNLGDASDPRTHM